MAVQADGLKPGTARAILAAPPPSAQHEIAARQIELFCAPRWMVVEGAAVAPIGGDVRLAGAERRYAV
jgi:hypothetical protein